MIITSTVSPALKIGLQFLGMWPNVPHSTIYWLSFMLSMLIIQYFQYLYIFNHYNVNELLNVVDALTATLDYSLTFFKLISLWIHRRVLHQVLTDMENDWRECMNVDQHSCVMQVKANIAHFCSNAMLSVNATVSVLYFLGEYIIDFIFLAEESNDTLRQFPVKTEFPYVTQQSPFFELLFAILLIHIMLHASAVGTVNGLIFTLVLHVSGQIDIMCQELRNISENILLQRSSVPLFRMLIERHNRIISFSENIEKLFFFIALMQIVWNTLVICSIGFVFIIFIHSETGVFVLVKTAFAYCGIMMEAFIICFAGEYLSHKGKLIANATYDTLWYNMPSNESKIIIFIIMRSQKRLAITAGKMVDMSFETFSSIVKASASYISVLNAMY
ncbi:PREDICTED: odorant receptor 13a-like [Vollenhovia emeryi]|uniref:odorant receptor 13a-like n=1 Tax=Vollenhovia emeryi TaxID=411798 RepID=UPI0005F439BA|nr:PREDICTED: odorant receptor 13a-like [Vollenhovia emeryi]